MARLIRFKDDEVDLAAGQLRKRGLRVRLPDQAFQVLTILLEHPMEAVTREELRRRLWPEDVFVNFDNNLNSAVARLREALNDSAEHPRFEQRKGYRKDRPRTPRSIRGGGQRSPGMRSDGTQSPAHSDH